MLTEVDPRWRFNTSKKISQLTKVVFRLHSNSMDHRDSAVELKERYEDEISEILSEGKNWLDAAQKEAESFHPTIESVVRKEFENKFDQTKTQFDTAKKKLLSQTEKLIKNATSQIESIRLQLEQIKQKSSDDQKEFTEIANQINQLTEQSTGQMEGNRKKVIERLVAEANAKYDATLQITQKKEQEMREKYESENESLKKTLESSKISAEDTLDQTLKTITESIDQINKDNVELANLVKQFSDKSKEHKIDIEKVFVIAEAFRDKILENQKKDLYIFQAQLQKIKDDHETEVKNMKDIIASEENSFSRAYNQKVAEYEKYDQICKQKISEYEELNKKATAEAELKNQQLLKEHNETLEKFETAKIQYIDNEHEKSHLVNQKVIEIHKCHQQKVTEIRNQIENQLDEYLSSLEKVRNEQQSEIVRMKIENKNQISSNQKKLFETIKDDSNETKNYLIQKAKLKNSMELSKFEFKRDSENIESNKNQEMTIIQREHEAKMEYLDHEFDFQVKEIDEKMNALFEKEKKQFLINSKFATERSNIDIKHSIESTKFEIEKKNQEQLEAEREKNENELSLLSQEIEEKTIEKKAIDIRLQNDLVDHNSKLSEMQKEVKQMESNWVGEKQKYLANWNEKFDKIKSQLTEEEKQNEDMRKFDESKCQQIVDKLKSELQQEEENGAKELQKIKNEIEEEKKKSEGEINRIKGEIEKLTTNRESSVSDLEKKLESLKTERENLINQQNEKKNQQIQSENEKLKELRKSYQKETCDLKSSLFEKSNECEKQILDLKIKLEQSQLDFSYLVDEFQRKKQLELQIIENKNQYEIEILTIELVKLQNEADRISEESKQNLDSLKSLEKSCNKNHSDDASILREKTEKEINKKIEEKQKLVGQLSSEIENNQEENISNIPRQIDLEHISCLEEVLNERNEANEMLNELIKKYEAFFIEHELHFMQLKEGKQQPKIQDMPTIVAPLTQSSSKKLKRDKMSPLLSSQRKVTTIKDYSSANRKSKLLV